MKIVINRIAPTLWEIGFRLSAGPKCTLRGKIDVKTAPGVELTRDMAAELIRAYREPAIRHAMELARRNDAESQGINRSKVRTIR